MKPQQADEQSNVFDGVSVKTPQDAADMDRLSAKMSTVGIKDLGQQAQGAKDKQAGQMQLFMQNLAKSDKAHYDQLVELMRLYKLVDVDLRLVSQLKASFISKDSGTLAQIPLSSL